MNDEQVLKILIELRNVQKMIGATNMLLYNLVALIKKQPELFKLDSIREIVGENHK